jgi:hypothetical protein
MPMPPGPCSARVYHSVWVRQASTNRQAIRPGLCEPVASPPTVACECPQCSPRCSPTPCLHSPYGGRRVCPSQSPNLDPCRRPPPCLTPPSCAVTPPAVENSARFSGSTAARLTKDPQLRDCATAVDLTAGRKLVDLREERQTNHAGSVRTSLAGCQLRMLLQGAPAAFGSGAT